MLGRTKIYPYYYPTTVLVLDDDPAFLDSFVFRYGEELLFRPCRQPTVALEHVHWASLALTRHHRCLISQPDGREGDDWSPADRTVTVRPSLIRELARDERRFEEVSVAIVDYDMPCLDGIEFCRRIKSLPVRKIMLTGKVDEKMAVAAFNERIIDRFIIKHDVDAGGKFVTAVTQLQEEYFGEVTAPAARVLDAHGPSFLTDPTFTRFCRAILEREGIAEYYLSAEPPGLLMVRPDGRLRFLLVQDEAALRFHQEMAGDCGVAPRELIEQLGCRDRQPWFPTAHGYYDVSCLAWQNHLYPADRVGTGGWYCSVIEADPGRFGLDGRIPSCDAYRLRQERGCDDTLLRGGKNAR